MGWLLTGLLAAALFAVGGREVRSFERRAAEDIASRLSGNRKVVHVSVELDGLIGGGLGRLRTATISARNFSIDGLPLFTEAERTKRGVIGQLRIRLNDFVLRGLEIEELRADINDCRFDLGLAMRERIVRLSRSGFGPGYVRVNETALEKFILQKYKEIKEIKVALKNDRIYVEGKGDFLLFTTNFYVSARLVPMNDIQLWLDDAWILFDGQLVTDGTDKLILKTLNPIIDENEDLGLYSALAMEMVRCRNGKLELFGTATVPKMP